MEPIQEQDLRRVVEIYSHMLLRVAMTRVPTTADAEDVVQDVFLRLMTHSPRFRDGEHEKAWLLRTTLNRAGDLCRRRRDDACLDAAESVAAEAPDYGPLLSAVRSLPQAYSAVIHLYYYEGYSAMEIAGILGRKENTIYTWLSKAKNMLREKLGGEWT